MKQTNWCGGGKLEVVRFEFGGVLIFWLSFGIQLSFKNQRPHEFWAKINFLGCDEFLVPKAVGGGLVLFLDLGLGGALVWVTM